jgi:predicted lipid-binding transport protein (Tim44 family)
MGENSELYEILIFAMIAGFILLRLRSVLGRRTGHHQRPTGLSPSTKDSAEGAEENVIPLPDQKGPARAEPAADDTPLGAALARIKMADRGFEVENFLAGARAAYEMIVLAFAAGDENTLQDLLDRDVFHRFHAVIRDRQDRDLQHETTIVSMDQAEIIEAEMQGSTAMVTVKFVGQLVNVTRNEDGAVVDGDPNAVDKVTDIWTFSRDTKSSDPNWLLVATRVPN